jgi:hypothetical protein
MDSHEGEVLTLAGVAGCLAEHEKGAGFAERGTPGQGPVRVEEELAIEEDGDLVLRDLHDEFSAHVTEEGNAYSAGRVLDDARVVAIHFLVKELEFVAKETEAEASLLVF